MLTAVIPVFHYCALSIVPVKCTDLWISIWIRERAIACFWRMFWWSVRRQSSQKCHEHQTCLVKAIMTDLFLFKICHQKCCKSHLFNDSFFLFICLLHKQFSAIEAYQQICRSAPVSETFTFIASPVQRGLLWTIHTCGLLVQWSLTHIHSSKLSKRPVADLDTLSPIAAEMCT